MNKLTKLLFSVISSVAIATSAFAGEFTVSGGVKATYTVLGNTGTTGTHAVGKGLGISNEFSLTASGELDNGMTWSYAQDIDGATVQDDASLAFGTDYGTVKLCVSECGLSTKYAFDNSAYGVGSDNGYGGGKADNTMTYGSNISSYNNIQYHAPADLLPLGMTFKAGMTPGGIGGNANASSHNVNGDILGDMTQYAVTMAPIDGLTLSASYYEFGEMGNKDNRQTQEGGSYAANYSIGQISVGYGETLHAPAQRMETTAGGTTLVQHYENDAYSIGFAVNDNLSVSYTESNETYDAQDNASTAVADVDMEVDAIQFAYSMGGMSIKAYQMDVTNPAFDEDADDSKVTEIALGLAF